MTRHKCEIGVIVPTKNSARTIRACLVSILQQSGVTVDLVVVDNYSTDNTVQIAEDLGARVIMTGPERSAQRNSGLEAAAAEAVIFIDSDMVLAPGCLADVAAMIESGSKAVVIPELAFGSNLLGRVKAWEKAAFISCPEVQAARGFCRSTLRKLGGWNEDLTGPEDWELTDRFLAHGWSVDESQGLIWHDEGSPTLTDLVRKKRYYAPSIRQYLSSSTATQRSIFGRFGNRGFWKKAIRSPGYLVLFLLVKLVEGVAVASASLLSAVSVASRNPYRVGHE